jgi:ABC-2 type transport system permease protein
VLSKVVVGMGVIPLVAFAVGLALYVTMSLLAIIIAAVNGANGFPLFANSGFGEALVLHVYVAIVAILWSAPLYAWAIFVSSWVRRAAFLWALLPPAGIALAEGLAFGTSYFAEMVGKRVSGGIQYAFVDMGGEFEGKHFKFDSGNIPESLLTFTDPARFFSQPGLWIGLVVAAGLIAAAIWMRRYREPL